MKPRFRIDLTLYHSLWTVLIWFPMRQTGGDSFALSTSQAFFIPAFMIGSRCCWTHNVVGIVKTISMITSKSKGTHQAARPWNNHWARLKSPMSELEPLTRTASMLCARHVRRCLWVVYLSNTQACRRCSLNMIRNTISSTSSLLRVCLFERNTQFSSRTPSPSSWLIGLVVLWCNSMELSLHPLEVLVHVFLEPVQYTVAAVVASGCGRTQPLRFLQVLEPQFSVFWHMRLCLWGYCHPAFWCAIVLACRHQLPSLKQR